jgi:alpha-ketoglutarate-dependent taurine dioxygenase
MLEGLTAYHSGHRLRLQAQAVSEDIRTDRGSPQNQGSELDSIHPVVRTNPVTGWKSVFLSNNFTQYITELKFDESKDVITHVSKLISQNHDLQCRFKWGKNDVAIWDNRSVFHTGTTDVLGVRLGDRVVSLGERPYFDPNSKSRREALAS